MGQTRIDARSEKPPLSESSSEAADVSTSAFPFVLGGVLSLLVSGCAGPALGIDPGPYAGPPARIEPGERTHVAVFTMPTGGWGLKFDRVRDQFDARRVFVTLRRPGPGEAATQALVEQRADTRVRLTDNVEIYARIVEKEADPGPYRLAARASKR